MTTSHTPLKITRLLLECTKSVAHHSRGPRDECTMGDILASLADHLVKIGVDASFWYFEGPETDTAALGVEGKWYDGLGKTTRQAIEESCCKKGRWKEGAVSAATGEDALESIEGLNDYQHRLVADCVKQALVQDTAQALDRATPGVAPRKKRARL